MSVKVWPRGLTFTSATLSDHGTDAATGDIRYGPMGRIYILVKNGTSASATIADGAACASVTGATVAYTSTTADVKVIITAAVTDTIICANNTGAAIPGDHYFWGLMKGRGYCIAGASANCDGLALVPHTTDGAMTAISTGATTGHCGFCITDMDTTVTTTNAVFWDLPSKNEGA